MTSRTAISPSTMALDHPGWLADERGRARRVFRVSDTLWAVVCEPVNAGFEPAFEIVRPGVMTAHPMADWFNPATLPIVFHTAPPVHDGVQLCRIRNPDLWEALIPPILRQRRRATDAAKQYRRLCLNHGNVIDTTAGPTLLPPDPETVAALPDSAFIDLGVRDKREHLRTVAEAYLKQADRWGDLSPAELFIDLQTVTYIGAATAGATVADLTNDYSFLPTPTDIAYRYWQRYLAPAGDHLSQREFAEAWVHLSREQRSTLTVLLLAAMSGRGGQSCPAQRPATRSV
jgi:DNA-3-methyladenine glycosylase II